MNHAYGITEKEVNKGAGLKLKILEPAPPRAAPAPEVPTQGNNIQRAIQATLNQAKEKLTTSTQETRNATQAEIQVDTAPAFEVKHNFQIVSNETVIDPRKEAFLKKASEDVEVSNFYKRHFIKEDYFY